MPDPEMVGLSMWRNGRCIRGGGQNPYVDNENACFVIFHYSLDLMHLLYDGN